MKDLVNKVATQLTGEVEGEGEEGEEEEQKVGEVDIWRLIEILVWGGFFISQSGQSN